MADSAVYSDVGVRFTSVEPVPFLLLSITAAFIGDAPLLALESMLALALPAGGAPLDDRFSVTLVLPPEAEAVPAPLLAADPPPVLSVLETEFAAALGEPSLPTDAVPELEESLRAVPVPETLAAPLADALAESDPAMASDPVAEWRAEGPTRSSLTGTMAKTSARLLIAANVAGFD